MSKAIIPQSDLVWVIPSRLLATVVDYLVISAFASLATRVGFSFDTLFIATFVLGALYFGFGNSRWSNGQTLGKRAFGIQATNKSALMSCSKSVLRYALSIGAIILTVEVPQLLFRRSGFVASLAILELPMLLALNFLAVQFACIVTSNGNIGLHDFILKTSVIRKGNAPKTRLSRTTLAFALAFSAISSILWFGQIQLPPGATMVYQHRFLLERDIPIRILQVIEDDTQLQVSAIVLTQDTDYDGIADRMAKQVQQALQNIGQAGWNSSKKATLLMQFEHGSVSKEREL